MRHYGTRHIPHWLLGVVAIICLSATWVLAGASEITTEAHAEPISAQLTLDPVSFESTAFAYAVFDVVTGEILAGQATTALRSIASITKLPAARVVREMITLDDETVVLTAADIATYGTAGQLSAGSAFSARELLYPLLLTSSNDAAAALERWSDGALVAGMTELAQRSGAHDTQFADASGLSDNNRSTAADLARMTSYLYRIDPTLFVLTTLPQYLGVSQGWSNNSPVLTQPGYRGGKHGYTSAAGRTLVALFDESIDGQTRTLGYVVLGSTDLATDLKNLRASVSETARFE